MRELELEGIHDDGEHVLLKDLDGEQYTLRIDEALRAAVRRDRPALNLIQATEGAPLRPKEIQALLRSGRSAEEIAEMSSIEVEHVRRYEGPVLAERGFIAERARTFPVGRAEGPTLDETVTSRLAARQALESARWDAWRLGDGGWMLQLVFTAGGRDREAHWIVDTVRRSVTADDDEARWLTLDEDAAEPAGGRGRLSALRSTVYDQETPAAGRGTAPSGRTDPFDEDELDALNARRGMRPVRSLDDEPSTWSTLEEDAQRDSEADDEHRSALPAARAPRVFPLAAGAGRSADASADGGEDEALEVSSPIDQDEDPAADPDAQSPSEDDRDTAAEGSAAPLHAADTVDLTPLPGFDAIAEEPRPAKKVKPRRSSIPSWDEIVFGSKHD